VTASGSFAAAPSSSLSASRAADIHRPAQDEAALLVSLAHVQAADALLVQQMIDGSETALGALYDRHVEAVFTVALRLCGDHGIAESVVQQTFLALWNRAELFDPAQGSLSAWLLPLATAASIAASRPAPDRAAIFRAAQ
jgi:hypothetical protein